MCLCSEPCGSMWQEPKLAFEDVDATELYPCVMFYSSNPGEKVRHRSADVDLNSLVFCSSKIRLMNCSDCIIMLVKGQSKL